MSTNYFSQAYDDYKHLRERGYPEKAALKLVCDHHRLSRLERNGLFRGCMGASAAGRRAARIVPPSATTGQALGIDWYNVLITVESYLRGTTIFVADDGILRDCAATHGGYRSSALTGRALEAIVAALAVLAPARVDACLDAPIAYSGLMAEDLRRRLAVLPFPSDAALAHSADYLLKGYEGIVCTSDSVIMDRVERVMDLPRWVLHRAFAFSPPTLVEAFPARPGGDREGPPQSSGSGTPAR
jgi:hypothetical protein